MFVFVETLFLITPAKGSIVYIAPFPKDHTCRRIEAPHSIVSFRVSFFDLYKPLLCVFKIKTIQNTKSVTNMLVEPMINTITPNSLNS